MAKASFRPTIEVVFNRKDSKSYNSKSLLLSLSDNEDHSAKRLRLQLYELSSGNPENYLYVCALCGYPVKLQGGAGRDKRQLHFFHGIRNEQCPYHEGKTPTREELNRAIYALVRESDLHKLLKDRLEECLLQMAEHDRAVSDVKKEKQIRRDPESWKKPDLNFRYNNIHIATELQLSSTYLDVILERHRFYEDQGIFVLWIFNTFDLEEQERKFVFDDVIFRNNANAYIFDAPQYEKSLASNQLCLRCCYYVYSFNPNTGRIESELQEKEITLADLMFDTERKVLYYYNSMDSLNRAREFQNKHQTFVNELLAQRENKAYEKESLEDDLRRLNNTVFGYTTLYQTTTNSIHEIWNNYKETRKELIHFQSTVPEELNATSETNEKVPTFLDDARKSKILLQINFLEARLKLDKSKLTIPSEQIALSPKYGELIELPKTDNDAFYEKNKELLFRRHQLQPLKAITKWTDHPKHEMDYDLFNRNEVKFYLNKEIYLQRINERISKTQTDLNNLIWMINNGEGDFYKYKITELKKRQENNRTKFKDCRKELARLDERLTIRKEDSKELIESISNVNKQLKALNSHLREAGYIEENDLKLPSETSQPS